MYSQVKINQILSSPHPQNFWKLQKRTILVINKRGKKKGKEEHLFLSILWPMASHLKKFALWSIKFEL